MKKRCSKCGDIKDTNISFEYLGVFKRGQSKGLPKHRDQCKTCYKEIRRERNQKYVEDQKEAERKQAKELIAGVMYYLDRNCPRRAQMALCQAKARMPESGLSRLVPIERMVNEQLLAKRKELME